MPIASVVAVTAPKEVCKGRRLGLDVSAGVPAKANVGVHLTEPGLEEAAQDAIAALVSQAIV